MGNREWGVEKQGVAGRSREDLTLGPLVYLIF